ncbi:nuclear transport factor 2 family protein [Methanofollis fontis]|nr:nuclear transport factor 2 family protein [Methanofollis fontis]
MFLSEKTREAIISTMYAYASAYSRMDVNGVMELMAPEVMAIGSGEDEWLEGREQVQAGTERDFSECETVSIEYGDLRIAADGIIAWVATPFEITAIAGGRMQVFRGRLTAVLMDTWEGWRFVQMHFSFPNADQEEGRSFPVQG